MPEYRGCVLEGYGVLPSPPRQVRVSNVQEDFAIVHWSSPAKLPATVTGYNVHYRPLSTYEAEYHVIPNVHPPYILEKLYANAEYEVQLRQKFFFPFRFILNLWNRFSLCFIIEQLPQGKLSIATQLASGVEFGESLEGWAAEAERSA